MLVVDFDTLKPIDILHFVGDVDGERLSSLQAQDIVRIRRAIDNHFAFVHHLAIVHENVLILRDQILMRRAFEICDDQTLLALGVLAEGNRAGKLGEHTCIFRRPRFEKLGHTGQTAGNVAGLGRFLRQTCQHVTDRNLLTVGHGDNGTDLEGNRHRMIAAMHADFFAIGVIQLDLRTQPLGLRLAASLRVDDDERRQPCHFVNLLGDRHAFFDVLEFHLASVFGDDRPRVWIPGSQLGASLDRLAVGHLQS